MCGTFLIVSTEVLYSFNKKCMKKHYTYDFSQQIKSFVKCVFTFWANLKSNYIYLNRGSKIQLLLHIF